MNRSKRRTNVSSVPAIFSAEIVLAGDKAPPTQIRLLKSGLNETDRPAGQWDAGPHLFDDFAAAMVMANYEASRKEDGTLPRLQIDWNHGMLDPNADRDRGASAGTFVPAVINGELWATDIQWTEDGARDVVSKSYNYESPAFALDYGEDGQCRPRKLVNFALVNLAGLKDARELMAASAALLNAREQPEETTMAIEEKLETELRTRIATLTTERDAAVTELAGARTATSEVVALGAAVGVQATAPNAERLSAVSGLVALKGDLLKATGAETPAAALAALGALVALKGDVTKITGQETVPGVLGVLSAWKTKSDGYDKLAADVEQRETVALAADLKSVLDKAKSEGKAVDPAARDALEKMAINFGGAGKPNREGTAMLSAYIATMRPDLFMQGAAGNPQPRAANGAVISAERLEIAKQFGRKPEEIVASENKRLGVA